MNSDMKSISIRRWLSTAGLGAVLAAAALQPGHARAQDITPAAATLDEVIVSPRKRAEKLLDTPVAITALTSRSIETRGVSSIGDLAAQTPGFSMNNSVGGSGRSDRSFPVYIIRGMVPVNTSVPTTSIFIDGAPIPSGQVEGIDDLERVEVLKGPQSAYFGRQTFAGAVSLVTKDPSNVLGGSISALAGQRNYYDVRGTLEGPIIADKLTARATVRYYTRDGSYKNAAPKAFIGGTDTLGDQESESATLQVVAKPVEGLKIKGFATYYHDDDGPSAQVVIRPNQSNCVVNNTPYFCGVAPGIGAGQPVAITVVDSQIKDLLKALSQPGTQLHTPIDHFGLERDSYHGSLGIEYEIPSLGITFNSLTAGDKSNFNSLQALASVDTSKVPNPYFGVVPGQMPYFNFPFAVQQQFDGFSQEFRLTSNQDSRLRWIVGVNYSNTVVKQSLGGTVFNLSFGISKTSYVSEGLFGGVTYDVLPKLTVSVEGRYQKDSQTAGPVSGSFKNFTPRVIAQYKFTPDIMGYVTYSKGINPGAFNTIYSLPAAAQVTARGFGASDVVRPEKLVNYEAGLKGRFLDGKATLSADVYYDEWSDQIFNQPFFYPFAGTQQLSVVYLNSGASTARGIELDGTWRPIDHLDINAGASINDTEITKGDCGACSQIYLTNNIISAVGKELPNVSKYQAALGVQYGDSLKAFPGWDWFARVDYTYKSGSYVLPDNVTKSPDLNFVNVRAGINSGAIRLEAFITNLTDEDGYTNLAPLPDLSIVNNPRNDSLFGGLPQKRTFGVRAKWNFGG